MNQKNEDATEIMQHMVFDLVPYVSRHLGRSQNSNGATAALLRKFIANEQGGYHSPQPGRGRQKISVGQWDKEIKELDCCEQKRLGFWKRFKHPILNQDEERIRELVSALNLAVIKVWNSYPWWVQKFCTLGEWVEYHKREIMTKFDTAWRQERREEARALRMLTNN
jgi:hypothetical protein